MKYSMRIPAIPVTLLTLASWMLFPLGNRSNALAADANLSWSANSESSLAGYNVYYGTASRSYGTPINVGNKTNYVVAGLSSGTYYFAVTAYNTSGYESGFSNEVSKTIVLDPPLDTTPPLISAVQAKNITASSATITWTTDKASDTQVDYGTTTAYGSSTVLLPTPVTSHSVQLTGLQASSVYHFRVKSRDAAGNLAVSAGYTMKTLLPPPFNLSVK